MSHKEIVKKLAKKAGKKKALVQSDLAKFHEIGTNEYYQLEKDLSELEIDVLLDDDEELEVDEVLLDDEDEEVEVDTDNDEPDEFSLSSLEVEEVEEEELLNIETIPSSIKVDDPVRMYLDRKSTRLNSSHVRISYAVFC